MEEDRFFTVEEVNELIPRLEAIIEQMQRHGRAIRTAVEELAQDQRLPSDRISTKKLLELRPELRDDATEIERLLAEIEAFGGEFKGLDLGLIDFPTEIDGETVLLCWQYGEKEITHYHTADDGFAGRKPLDPKRSGGGYLQ